MLRQRHAERKQTEGRSSSVRLSKAAAETPAAWEPLGRVRLFDSCDDTKNFLKYSLSHLSVLPVYLYMPLFA